MDVNLGTVRNVEEVLRKASVPVTRYFILKGLKEQGHSTTQPRLNLALDYLIEKHLAFEGERGIQWTAADSDSLRRAAATGHRVA
jgi:hypothetical protein